MNHENKIVVSIIVPCYNYGMFLGECLESVISQTYSNWECIILDNGSTDNTKEVCSVFCKKDKRFIYEFTEQRGVSFARNLAIKLSKGNYLLPLDADDKIASSFIEKALAVIEKSEKIKLVYSDAELFGASSGKWILPKYNLKDLLIENSIFCTALYRKSDFELTGGYNEDMKEGFEDWDFWISLLKTGGEVFKISEVLFFYRIRSNSRNSVLDREKQLKLRQKIYNNHKATYDSHFSIPELVFEKYVLNSKLNSIEQSKEYVFGKKIMGPLRFIKSLISK